MAKDEVAADAPQNKSSWTSFLRSIASFNGDLSSLTAPAFILGTTSLTEFSGYWAEHPSVFVAPAAEKDPAKRALLVLKWFLSTLRQQYCSRSDELGTEKKPLNPFLGELFLAKWDDEAGETKLISEQVSHHPPVTAYNISNEKHGVRLQGYNGQKATFSSTIVVRQVGHALLHLDAFDEDYFISLPSLHIEGLIRAAPFVELDKHTTISSSSGFVAHIDYSGRGWLSGKKNTFTATLSRQDAPKDPLYTIDGQWNESFTVREGSGKKGAVVDSWRSTDHKTTPLVPTPANEQDPRETKRAWAKVVEAIRAGNMDATSAEKSKIENAQREMRRQEQASGKEWERTFFSKAEPDAKLEKLATAAGEKIEPEKTGGVWVFDKEKAANAKRPYPPAL